MTERRFQVASRTGGRRRSRQAVRCGQRVGEVLASFIADDGRAGSRRASVTICTQMSTSGYHMTRRRPAWQTGPPLTKSSSHVFANKRLPARRPLKVPSGGTRERPPATQPPDPPVPRTSIRRAARDLIRAGSPALDQNGRQANRSRDRSPAATTSPAYLPAAVESGSWIGRYRAAQALGWGRRNKATIDEAEDQYGLSRGTIRRQFASQRGTVGRRRRTVRPRLSRSSPERESGPCCSAGRKSVSWPQTSGRGRAYTKGHSDGSAIAKFAGKRVGGVALETNLDRLVALFVSGQVIYGLSP